MRWDLADLATIIIIIISVLFITLTCNLPERCDEIKLSNLLRPRYRYAATSA